jgi:sec-independent protein translocase protein TatA
MGALEPPHLIIILVIVLVIFGPGKLPQLGKAVGDGIRELKHASDDTPPAAQPLAASAQQPVTAVDRGRPCAQCQSLVPPSDRFCGVCGAAVHPVTAAGAASTGAAL